MALLAPMGWLALVMTVPLSGTVEDAAGRPVAGATVWLGDTIATRKGPEVLSTAETDDQGRFRLERADDLAGRGGIWSPTLWAYKPGSRLAFVEFKRSLPAADEPVKLVLGPPASTSLRVLYPDGWAVHDARVRPVQLNLKAPRPPDKLLDRLAVTTDGDGRATIDGLAPADLLALDVTAEGLIVQCLAIDPDTGDVTFRPVGNLRVRVTADDPRALPGWSITITPHPTEPGYRGPYAPHWSHETTGRDGRASFPPLAEGVILWGIKPPEGSAYLAQDVPGARIRAGETTQVEIPLRKGVRVEGTILEEPGGVPIPGVKVDVATLRQGSRTVRWLVTDAQGRFSGVVLPGTVRFDFSLHDMPKGYFLPPGTPHWVDLEVKEGEAKHVFDPPRLRKAVQVRGQVVDGAGKPAAGVAVIGSWTSAEYGRNPNSNRAETDARGEFLLGSIAPKAEVRVSASSGSAAESEAVVIPSAGEGEPVTLRLRRRPTLALSGRVLGPDGRPMAGALVVVKVRQPNQPIGRGSDFAFEGPGEIRTGPDGRFRTPGQIPIGNDYRVEVQAPGHEPADSKWVAPPTREIPDVSLRRAVGMREVLGRVVDSAGKPVDGVEVYQSGDGPRRARGLTDGEGRFRVPGVPDAPAFLFASKAGYRLLGRRVDPGEGPVELALRRLDEAPAAPLRRASPAVPRDEERAIVRGLIARAKDAIGSNFEVPDRRLIPEITALVDPDRVVEMIENQVLQADPGLLTSLALGRSEGDFRKGLEVVDAIGEPNQATLAAQGLFDRVGATLPAGSRRELLDLADRRAREIDEPGQAASQLARVADRWLDLGEGDRADRLLREARARADRPRQQPFPDPRDDLALALARVDLPAALRLLEGRSDQQYQLDRARAGIAERIATTDPAGVRRVLGLISDQARPWARRAACLRMAAKDLPASRALAAEAHDPMLEALLPAVAARARAESSLVEARALLLEAVERLARLDDGPATRPSPAVALARLLPMAARIDPDRAPGYLWLALSRRPPLSSLPEPMPVLSQVRQQYLDRAELAVLVARYDRAAAEVVFAPVAARLVGMDDQHWGLGPEGPALFRAAGAFDGRVAGALLDALPEDPLPPPVGRPTGGSTSRHHSKAEARVALAGMLALPPGLRLRRPFLPNLGNDWLEGLDD